MYIIPVLRLSLVGDLVFEITDVNFMWYEECESER